MSNNQTATTVHNQGSNTHQGNGKKPYKKRPSRPCRATVDKPQWHLLLPGEPVAFDGEFQNYRISNGKWQHRHGRAAVVNTRGQVILDCFVMYRNEPGVQKKYNKAFGVDFEDLRHDNGAVWAENVEFWLKQIFRDRPVIVHDVRGDSNAFYIETSVKETTDWRDTQVEYGYLQPSSFRPGLKLCASTILGKTIQAGVHNPIEDAETAMELWLLKNTYDRNAEGRKLMQRHGQSRI